MSAFDTAMAHLAVRATARQICVKITNGEIRACPDIKEHIRIVGQRQINLLRAESLDKDLPTFINGLRNKFAGVEYV